MDLFIIIVPKGDFNWYIFDDGDCWDKPTTSWITAENYPDTIKVPLGYDIIEDTSDIQLDVDKLLKDNNYYEMNDEQTYLVLKKY